VNNKFATKSLLTDVKRKQF